MICKMEGVGQVWVEERNERYLLVKVADGDTATAQTYVNPSILPVRTTFPETKISRTMRGFTMR